MTMGRTSGTATRPSIRPRVRSYSSSASVIGMVPEGGHQSGERGLELAHRLVGGEADDRQGAPRIDEPADPLGDLIDRAGDQAPMQVLIGEPAAVVVLVEAARLLERGRRPGVHVDVEVD